MKRLTIALIAIALLLASCGDKGTGTKAKLSDITPVAPIQPTAVATSGATTAPTTMAQISAILSGVNASPTTDPFIADMMAMLSASQTSTPGGPPPTAGARAISAMRSLSRATSGDFQTQLNKIMTDIQNLPVTKSLDDSLSLANEPLGSYLMLTSADGTFSATITTSDNAALDMQQMANFKAASMSATAKIVVDPTVALSTAGSAIKDLKFRLNAGGTASVSTKTVSNQVTPDKVTFDYGESCTLALSIDSNGTGGKIILAVDAKYAGTVDAAAMGSPSSDLSTTIAPTITISIKVYADDGTLALDKTYNDMNVLVADLTQAPPAK